MNTVLYLYAELMPYNIPVLEELVRQGYEVHVVHWDQKKLTPYIPPPITGVVYYERSSFSSQTLCQLVAQLLPKMLFAVGWMDKGYINACKYAKQTLKIPVIASSDTQWKGGKQWGNVLFSRFRHRRWFDRILISGNHLQYEYARRLGFKPTAILSPYYSADISIFSKVSIEEKKSGYPRQLLFIGRLAPEKRILELIQVWKAIPDRRGWQLRILGSGLLKERVAQAANGIADISLGGFVTQATIAAEMQQSGCFIIPSVFEPWALVIHEAAAAGLPILASNACGATNTFVIHNHNGFIFDPKDEKAIQSSITKILEADTAMLLTMSTNSRTLSKRINPQQVAAAILSVV